jgi:iron complex outermembrane receptor protein
LIHSLRSRRALLLAGSCCSSLLVLPSIASAQTVPDPQDPAVVQPQETTVPGEPDKTKKADEGAIVVTGIRRSVQDSIQIKRRETSMVEAVSAEEIGKLPDVSIAESIARLPGLAAQRVAGRAQIISVRGFSPDFTTVLLNGRQQASSG